MQRFELRAMKGGWFVGDFEPAAFRTSASEVCCKHYRAGDAESRHVHRVATEVTLIVSGRVCMNGLEYGAGDIVRLEPGDATDFLAMENTITVVVKTPSVMGDKYPA
jgi:hypothetical protein